MNVQFNKPPSSDDEVRGLKVNYAPARRPFAKWRFRLVLLLFLFPFVTYVAYLIYHYIVIIEPGFVLLKELKIKTPADGQVVMLKETGEVVTKGDTLAILKNDFLEAKYNNYLKKLEFNQKNIMETINNNRTALRIAKNAYNYRNEDYKRIKKLKEKGNVTQLDVSNALIQLESARLAYTNAKESLENSKLALKDVLNDKLELYEIKEKLKSLTIIAPENGTITSNVAREGELVQQYDELLVIDLHANPTMEVFLNPKNAQYAEVGKKVNVIFPNKQKINATVSKIQMRAIKTPLSLNNIFHKTPYSIVLELKLEKPLPKRFMINYLPIKVRFNLFDNH
ncbi:HlyD family efflux transporter periplasmic adaptor subunit [Sulfurimonas sp. NWX79]|uniref:HlyD family secretion protein n=1 Tax=Sulfurimonas sp. NWX79 TaxID=2925412 RepID=UPI003204DCBB